MQDIALRGLVADGRAEDFDSFGWFQPFGLDTQGVFELLPKALQEAQQVDPGYVAERHATRPLDPSEPEGELLVWPTRNSGLTLLLAKEAGEWAMTGCWPFLTSGSEHDAEIERVVLAPDRLRAMIEARIGGDNDVDVNLDIAVSATVLDGRPLPALGDDVEAVILLQGYIWIPAINTPDPAMSPASE